VEKKEPLPIMTDCVLSDKPTMLTHAQNLRIIQATNWNCIFEVSDPGIFFHNGIIFCFLKVSFFSLKEHLKVIALFIIPNVYFFSHIISHFLTLSVKPLPQRSGFSRTDRVNIWYWRNQTTRLGVGLLRMTFSEDLSFWGSNSHKGNGFEENTLLHFVNAAATEESSVASRAGEILRRPMIACKTTRLGVGLLRMTFSGNLSFWDISFPRTVWEREKK